MCSSCIHCDFLAEEGEDGDDNLDLPEDSAAPEVSLEASADFLVELHH